MPGMRSPRVGRTARDDHRGTPIRRGRRRLFAALGCVCVGLGAIGVVLPLLPTTPFMLLAAVCFARGSDRLHAWLLGTRLFGPTIRSWYETRTIPLPAKLSAITLVVVLLGTTIVFLVPSAIGRMALAAIGIGVILYVVRIPTRVPASDDSGAVPESPTA